MKENAPTDACVIELCGHGGEQTCRIIHLSFASRAHTPNNIINSELYGKWMDMRAIWMMCVGRIHDGDDVASGQLQNYDVYNRRLLSDIGCVK